MKDLRQPPISSTGEGRDHKSKAGSPSNRNVDAATMKKNPKVDAKLVSDFYRLVDASKGVIRGARGANYRLSHPLGSNDVPTDSNQIGKSLSEVKKT
ncbi:hypothetical protein F4054_22405 [Candidatus Poribacteria bacterium]|nr:hypothetical protein [Candidatus Poribacteria bacterium]MYK25004.1 hypothetical protein [Candidatus Poribacteria bacterium]